MFSSVSLVGLINTGSLGDMLLWFGGASERRGALFVNAQDSHAPISSVSPLQRLLLDQLFLVLDCWPSSSSSRLVSKVHCLDLS